MAKSSGNIENIYKWGLCTRCGTCVSVCPKDNIIALRLNTGDYKFSVKDPLKCNKCSGICYQACPGHEVNFDHFNKIISGKIPKYYAIGNYIRSYIAYSSDKEIRSVASAGGIVTQTLVHALETKRVDGVLAVSVGGATGMEPQFYVARDREGVLKAAQSKYFPIPKNVTLKEVLLREEKFAVVGVPCQIHGLRKGQELYKQLRDRVVFCIGLFCGRCPSYQAAKFIAKRAGYDPNDVNEMRHRYGMEYPGKYHLKLKSGEEMCLDDKFEIIGFGGLLLMDSYRCLVCPDRLNELSDISVGDAIMPTTPNEPPPNSVITRTNIGQEIVNELIKEQRIFAREVDIATCIRPQISGLINKKRGYAARSGILKYILCREVPKYKHSKPKQWNPIFADYLGGVVQIAILSLTRNKFIYNLLHQVPYDLLKKMCEKTFKLSSKVGRQNNILE